VGDKLDTRFAGIGRRADATCGDALLSGVISRPLTLRSNGWNGKFFASFTRAQEFHFEANSNSNFTYFLLHFSPNLDFNLHLSPPITKIKLHNEKNNYFERKLNKNKME